MVSLKKNFLLALLAVGSASAHAENKIRIVVSVDWEGDNLKPENLQAMTNFRRDYPQIPLQHFLNAAYYVKPGVTSKMYPRITAQIKSVLRPGDEHGLHIHAWRSLMHASGVDFLRTDTFVNEDYSRQQCKKPKGDCGNDVPLYEYSTEDLKKVIKFSSDTLTSHGFTKPTSFRAGGWMADDHVLDALATSDFTVDSSATKSKFLEAAWEGDNLPSYVYKLWRDITETSQPYRIKTEHGQIIELPNNGCLADYTTGDQIFATFEANALRLKEAKGDLYVSIGFHQETAADYLVHVRDGLQRIATYAQEHNIPYEFIVGPF